MSEATPERPDVTEVRQALLDIPRLYRLLPEALRSNTSGGKRAPRTSRNGVAGSPAPASVEVLHLLDTRQRIRLSDPLDARASASAWHDGLPQGVVPELFSWCRLVEAERLDYDPTLPDELPEKPDADNLCTWLIGSLDWCIHQQWWIELARDLLGIWRTLRQVLGEVEVRVNHEQAFGGCGYAIERVAGYWRCTGCDQEWTLHEVTLPEAATRLDVPARTLRHWAQRGLLVETGETIGGNGRSVRLYDLDSIRRIAAREALAQVA